MLRKKAKWAWTTAITLGFLGVTFVAVAAELPSSDVDNSANSARREITVDATILDRYVGFYQLNDHAVLTVTREGNQLFVQLTGQPTVPVYAQDTAEFFSKIVNAQISFVTDATGEARSAVLHQAGRDRPMQRIDADLAQRLTASIALKVKNQSATPGTEAALDSLVNGIISGNPDYSRMSPKLAEATRKQLPKLQVFLSQLGAIKSLKFLGVGPQGEDVYTVWQEHGSSHWRLALDSNGTISMATVTAGP